MKKIIKHKINTIFFIGLILSLTINVFTIKQFDRMEISSDKNDNHMMIKGAVNNAYSNAHNLIKNLKTGNNFFKSDNELLGSYLPPKILAAYYYLTSKEMYKMDVDNEEMIPISNNGKLLYLNLQSILYYFCLFIFYKKIRIPEKENIINFIIMFLALEPTIMFYHASFWQESIGLSIQLLFFAFLLNGSKHIFKFIFCGSIYGLLVLQEGAFIYYIILILVFFIFQYRKKSLKLFICFFIGYLPIISFVTFHNFERSNVAYFAPTESKQVLFKYFVPNIMKANENQSHNEIVKKMDSLNKNWIIENNLDIKIEKDRIKLYNLQNRFAINYILNNSFDSISYSIKQSFHMLVINPFEPYYFHKYEWRGKKRFYKSEDHNRLIPVKIAYTFVIYLICFFGLINSLKKKIFKLNFLFSISIIYFVILLGWMGTPRYFLPCLIFISYYFGNGINYFKNKLDYFKK